MPKDLSETEAQKSRKRHKEDKNNPAGPSSRGKSSIEDVTDTLRVIEDGLMGELPAWLNTNVISFIQQLEEASP